MFRPSSRFGRCLGIAFTASALALSSIAVGSSARAASDTPVAGGTIEWAYILRPTSLDPNVWSGGNDTVVMRQIYDPLVWSPKPGEYAPGLATSWTISEDGRVYTFKLREDVTFHDGTPFDANAVKVMFDRIADPETKSLLVGAIGSYESSQVIDPYTVEVHLKEPWGAFLSNLSSVALSPVSPQAIEKYGAQIGQNPVGTGPFMFEKWVGNDLYLKRNPDYAWASDMMTHPGQAYLDAIVVKEVPEASTRVNALRTGEVNFTHFPVLSQLAQIEDAGFEVHRSPQPGFSWSFPINIKRPPTDDLRVRQAILYGINRDQVVRSVIFGQSKAAYGPLTAVTFGYDPAVEEYYPYDPEKAAALLDEAGWTLPDGGGIRERDGEKLTIEMIMFDIGVNKAISELSQAMLQQLGIDAQLSVTNYAAFATKVVDADYHLSQMRWSALDPDQVIPTMFNSAQIDGGGRYNRTRIASDDLDKIIAEAGASTDPAVRRSLYSQIQLMAMEEAWIAPIYDDMWYWLSPASVQGITTDPEGRPLFHNIWIEE